MPFHLVAAQVGVFTEQKSLVRVTNATPLPLQFEWLRFELPPRMLPLTRQRTVQPEALSSQELGEPACVGELPQQANENDLQRIAQMVPFTVSPAEGFMQAGEATSFEFTFSPLAATLFGGAAILRPLNVPPQAMPGYDPAHGDGAADESNSLEVGVRLLGRGVGMDLKLDPLALVLHGGTTLGASVSHTFTLYNDNGSERHWRWLEAHSDALEGEALNVIVEPSSGSIDAGGSADIMLTMTPKALGLLKRSLTFETAPHGRQLSLPVEVLCVGSKVRIRTSRLDFGLVPLGDTKELTLTFDNLSGRDAKWMLVPAPLPRTDKVLAAIATTAAQAQADALGLPLVRQLPGELEWNGWDDLADPSSAAAEAYRDLDASLRVAHSETGLLPGVCCGTIRANDAFTITVTIDAAAEQSMRRMLELRVQHGPSAHISTHAEVVARRAALSPPAHVLGTTYVRVPVARTLVLTNLTNISTTFECVHHIVKGRAEVQMEPASGVLAPAQRLSILVTVISETSGEMDLFAGCTLHGGCAVPVGCRITAAVQGLTVSYEALAQDDPRLLDMPTSMPPPEDVVDSDGVVAVRPPPTIPPTPSIDFGDEVPIFEQKSLVLLVTNLSAVRTKFKLTPERYAASPLPIEYIDPPTPEDYTQTATALAGLKEADMRRRKQREAEERRARLSGGGPPSSGAGGADGDRRSSAGGPPQTATSQTSGGVRRQKSSGSAGGDGTAPQGTAMSRGSTRPSMQLSFHRPVLGDAHERLQPFSSESGTSFSAQRQLRRREEALLKGGKGACFEISPSEGVLEPWGIVAVTVAVHSNLWGLFDDVLIADVLGLPPVRIAMRAGIVGSPIRLHDATLGLSNITSPPTLSWAPVPVGSGPTKKTIRVLNRGPAPATLDWSIFEPPDPEHPIAANLRLGGVDGTNAALGLSPAPTPLLTNDAFRVSPVSDIVPPGGERHFAVHFVGDAAGVAAGSGDAAFEALLSATLRNPFPVPLPDGGESMEHPPLRLRLSGHSLQPRLQMSERSKLKFKVSPTMDATDPAYTRCLTMTNNSTAALQFQLAVPPPFRLVEARCSVAQFRIMGRQTVDETAVYVLPPDSSLQAVISYTPPKRRKRAADGDSAAEDAAEETKSVASQARSQATSAADTAGSSNEDVDMALAHRTNREAALLITFANGTLQSFPLLAVTTTPYIELSPPIVHGTPSVAFGKSHLSLEPERQLQMHNPTEAEAAWSISHQPYKPPPANSAAGARAKAAELAGEVLPTDDPTVFVFDQMSGYIAPKDGRTPVRYPLKVRFVPKAPGKYCCIFALKVRAGHTAKLEVSAEATLREEDTDVVCTDKHLRLMQYGEIA